MWVNENLQAGIYHKMRFQASSKSSKDTVDQDAGNNRPFKQNMPYHVMNASQQLNIICIVGIAAFSVFSMYYSLENGHFLIIPMAAVFGFVVIIIIERLVKNKVGTMLTDLEDRADILETRIPTYGITPVIQTDRCKPENRDINTRISKLEARVENLKKITDTF